MRSSGLRLLILAAVLTVGLIGTIRIVELLSDEGPGNSSDVASQPLPLPSEIARILDDGAVDVDELRLAVDLTADCMREAGLSVDVTFIQDDENATWGFDTKPMEGRSISMEEGGRLEDGCEAVWLDPVVDVFVRTRPAKTKPLDVTPER